MAPIGNRIRDGKQFVGGEHFVDVKNQAKLLAECSHAEQVFGLDASAKRRGLLDFISGEIDDLAHRVGQDSHGQLLVLEHHFGDDDASEFGNAAGGQSELYRQIDHRDNSASQIGDATDPERSVGHGGNSFVLNDLAHFY